MELENKTTVQTQTEISIELNKFSWARVGKIVGFAIFAVALVFGLYLGINSKSYKKASASFFKNNRLHLVDCQDLPFYTQAQKTFAQNTEAIEQLRKIGAVDILVNKVNCPSFDKTMTFSKGEINFSYENRSNRKAIEKKLGKDFFGIPYNDYNK